jgi:hypothetical protein
MFHKLPHFQVLDGYRHRRFCNRRIKAAFRKALLWLTITACLDWPDVTGKQAWIPANIEHFEPKK